MYSKAQLMFEQIKTVGLLYELRHQGPNKLIGAMGRFNATVQSPEDEDFLDDRTESAEAMVVEYMEHVYNGTPVPVWLTEIEKARA